MLLIFFQGVAIIKVSVGTLFFAIWCYGPRVWEQEPLGQWYRSCGNRCCFIVP
jgi:hypothetical protein